MKNKSNLKTEVVTKSSLNSSVLEHEIKKVSEAFAVKVKASFITAVTKHSAKLLDSADKLK